MRFSTNFDSVLEKTAADDKVYAETVAAINALNVDTSRHICTLPLNIVNISRKDLGTPTDRVVITDEQGNKYVKVSKLNTVDAVVRKVLEEI